jgi:tripartite-type tricarboxylate transporter receptor subunit TctC
MKRFILIAALFVSGMGVGLPAAEAQPYPNKPIQFIIPGTPGSVVDVCGRMVADDMAKTLGVPLVAVDKPGAAFTLGTDFVAKSKKDGYTIAYTTSSAIVFTRVLTPETVPYDPDRDLEPLGFHLFLANAVVVPSDSPWKTFAELIDYAKKNPGRLRVSTTGIGSTSHLNLELIQTATGAQFNHVPFKGGESVVTAVLGGHVELTLDALSKCMPHVEAGKLRVLLVDNKVPQHPQFPTLADLNYKQAMVTSWFGLYGPAGMPEEAKRVLIPAIEKAVNNPELKAKVEKMLFVTDYMAPAKQRRLVSDQYEQAMAIAVRAGLRKAR